MEPSHVATGNVFIYPCSQSDSSSSVGANGDKHCIATYRLQSGAMYIIHALSHGGIGAPANLVQYSIQHKDSFRFYQSVLALDESWRGLYRFNNGSFHLIDSTGPCPIDLFAYSASNEDFSLEVTLDFGEDSA